MTLPDWNLSAPTRMARTILVVLLLFLLVLWSPWINLAVNGSTTQGTVIEAQRTVSGTPPNLIRHRSVTYEYAPLNGEPLVLQEPVGEAAITRLSSGDTITVRYLPRKPQFAMIEGNFAKIVETSFGRIILSMVALGTGLALMSHAYLFYDVESDHLPDETPSLSPTA